MSEKDDVLPSALLEIMKSPQVGEILASLRTSEGGGDGTDAADGGIGNSDGGSVGNGGGVGIAERQTLPSFDGFGGLNLPPDFMEKLPGVISAISAMGFGSSADREKRPPRTSAKGNEQRKALLKALKPYLSPKRQTVVDSMLGLESLTGLLGNVGGNGKENR